MFRCRQPKPWQSRKNSPCRRWLRDKRYKLCVERAIEGGAWRGSIPTGVSGIGGARGGHRARREASLTSGNRANYASPVSTPGPSVERCTSATKLASKGD